MTRAKDISKIITDADFSGTLDVTGKVGILGTNDLGVGLHIKEGDSGVTSVSTDADQLVIENNAESGISLLAPTNSASRIAFGDSDNNKIGMIYYNHSSNFLKFDVNNAEALRIDSSGNVGIGTTTVSSGFKLEVTGDSRFGDAYNDDAVELGWSAGGSSGFVQAYDRGASAFRDLVLNNSITIKSGGNVGIGASSPSEKLEINSGTGNIGAKIVSTDSLAVIAFKDNSTTDVQYLGANGNNLVFHAGATPSERMRIADSDSRNVLCIGDTAVYTGITSTTATSSSLISMNSGQGSEIVLSHHDALSTSGLGSIAFNRGSAQLSAINGACDGATDSGNLKFYTTASGGSITERTRIINTGFFKTGNLGGTYRSATATFHEMITDRSGDGVAAFSMTNASYAGGGFQVIAARPATGDTYKLYEGYSGNGADREFRVDGDGTVHADGAYSSSGGDYAEMFEWSDGNTTNEDRVGKTVVLDGNQIRLSTSDDAQSSIIGVVSARPVVLGDAHDEKWIDKYETDDFGRYIREEYTQTEWIEEDEDGNKSHKSYETDKIPSDVTVPSDAIVTSTEVDGTTPLTRRKLNSSYNSSQTYIPREQRKEFSPIGLVGKLRVTVGQTVGDRWIKMREISDTVHEYLVR